MSSLIQPLEERLKKDAEAAGYLVRQIELTAKHEISIQVHQNIRHATYPGLIFLVEQYQKTKGLPVNLSVRMTERFE